ncbi:ATP-dependent endonuclease [uncultured Bacteroides sp.]|uniref:ATP-dependent endonuclease n=1 Tax=uncultured Bacteroides sp. TaxID=162156 RepID=UPI00258318DF|nr:ATP-dependent endonuclease [uncultured Bacteroides sp.]
MRINHVHIRNFRKLKNCRIDFDENQTIFVGANNSGKTSAMSAIIWFLKGKDRFTTREFTLTNWIKINELADKWLVSDEVDPMLLTPNQWDDIVPSLDIWIDVIESEAYQVYKIIPSLTWKKDSVGVRLRFEPKDIKSLYADYKKEVMKVRNLQASPEYKETKDLKLHPQNMWDFLNQKHNLLAYFDIKYYVLDSEKINHELESAVQVTPDDSLEENPLTDLIRIDSIEAFREFSDPMGKNESDIDTLSKQLQAYYRQNYTDETIIETGDLKLMEELSRANTSYDLKLQKSFSMPIGELSNINYPGFQNPSICIRSNVNIVDSISHDSSVQFSIQGKPELSLPEKYNGLGLRNLISIYLKLIQFREQWTRNNKNEEDVKKSIEPIHLVFIEEPEAHLHAQAQQVFIRKALEALTNATENNALKENPNLATQLIVSTHSNHIVNEVDMNCLRYFRRVLDEIIGIPVSKVVNMSRTFGENEKDTKKFVTRYIKLTHCDIFFADAAILVEGAAERILMPHFIKREGMDNYYISVIEINGSHAHRFSSLLKKLNILTVIVTDIDAQQEVEEDGKKKKKSTLPQRGQSQTTNNDTIKHWIGKDEIDDLLELPVTDKIKDNVHVVYQTGVDVVWIKDKETIYPYTFEDSLIFTNLDLFRGDEKLKKLGAVTTFYNYLHSVEDLKTFHMKIFDKLESSSNVKAEFANTLLYAEQFEALQTPVYIREGLEWLKSYFEFNHK